MADTATATRTYRRTRTALKRFEEKYTKDQETGCWVWQGSKMPQGYGRFSFGGRDNMGLAHRWSFSHYKGEIPDEMEIDHLCRNRACVNPDHLEVVTRQENHRRATPFRTRSTDTHCANGHEWSEETIYITPSGKRNCRACRNDSMVGYREKRRGK